jgi:hypothetical protein
MIGLTQTMARLAVYSDFEMLCHLPSNKRSIARLAQKLLVTDPNFFADNGAFWTWADDENNVLAERGTLHLRQVHEGYTDFDHTVVLLKDMFMEGLDDDSGPGRHAVLKRYEVPKLAGEKFLGQSIYKVLDKIQASTKVTVAFAPRDSEDVDAYAALLEAREAEHQAYVRRWHAIFTHEMAGSPETPQEAAVDHD